MADPLSIAAIGWGLTATGWFVSPYITRLLDKAYAHIKPGKAKKKIRSLVTDTVPRLKLILEAAEGSEHKHLFEELLTDLRSAFYATEDILDDIEYVRRHKTGTKRKFDSCVDKGPSNQGGALSSLTIPGTLRNLLMENVTKIEELIKEAHETINSANLQSNKGSDQHTPNVTANNINMPTISDPTGKVTGREKVLEELKEMLRRPSSSDSTCLSVIGIIGIPGSGKTTLAQCVCKSETNSNYFDPVMWIHVSENFTVHSIYSEMLEQAWKKSGKKNSERPQYNSLDMMSEELKKVLNGKQFLLVLDDIWFKKEEKDAEAKLQQLLVPLKVGSEGSKILVTSRHDSLSRLGPNVTSTKYQIPDLDNEVFLDLFMHYALNDKPVDEETKGKLQRIGAQIAKKLKKSPLLARVVGGTLFQRPTVEVRDWISVRDQNLLDKYMGALWWSYKHLDEHVRRCFAYCSIFPRRHPLRRDELVNLWVAQGFINTTNGGPEIEDVGRGYFNELLSTSFLLPGGEDYLGEYFLIHDLLHDLAVKVAGSDCFKIEDEWKGNISPDVRHLSIQSCNASMITVHIVKLENLRSLIIYSIDDNVSKEIFGEMFSKLSKLRVLILRTKKYVRELLFPESIGSLKHLRYLGIQAWVSSLTLPNTLTKLYFLQVLVLDCPSDFRFSFGEDMRKLVDLRHVITSHGAMVCFANIGMLTSLRTMPALNLSHGKGYEIHQLEDLNKLQGTLEIIGLECVKSKQEALKAKLADKEQLTDLRLSWGFSHGSSPDVQADVLEGLQPPEYLNDLRIEGYKGSRFPTWMVGTQKSSMHLRELALDFCRLPVCSPGHCFIPVSSLVLHTCDCDTLPYNMEDLTSLTLESMEMPSNMQHLTSLKRLIINLDCSGLLSYPDINALPTLPSSLDYIEIIYLEWDDDEDVKIWEKIKDIPNIVIDGESIGCFDDLPWVQGRRADLVDEGSEAMGSFKSAGSRTDPEGSGGGFPTERNNEGPSGGTANV